MQTTATLAKSARHKCIDIVNMYAQDAAYLKHHSAPLAQLLKLCEEVEAYPTFVTYQCRCVEY